MFRTATFGQRVAGSFIDGFVFLVPTGIAWAMGVQLNTWLHAGLLAIYTIGLTATSGQTVGKRMVGTRVVVDDASTAASPPLGACAIRWAVLAVPGLFPGPVGVVAGGIVTLVALYGIATDERARGIHDHLARTRVIEAM